jgi:hypothetical protein
MPLLFFRIAATLCFLAVAVGAFGAHSLKSTLETNGMLDCPGIRLCFIISFKCESRYSCLRSTAQRIAVHGGCFLPHFSFQREFICDGDHQSSLARRCTHSVVLCFPGRWAWLVISPTK